jgi:predicted alpha/beta-hydrolase family hydrolase
MLSTYSAERFAIRVDEVHSVSALLLLPSSARACYVFAHGAGAGMTHAFMQAIASSLGQLGIASLRFQFPYMERGSKRPDSPALCHATVRAAVATAAGMTQGLPLIAGGRSFGGRMSSQAQAASPLPGVIGLAFLGFPLHPAGRPSDERAQHLLQTSLPLLFLQGDHDELADLNLLRPVIDRLGARASLHLIEQANHSFRVPAKLKRDASQIIDELVQAMAHWIDSLPGVS